MAKRIWIISSRLQHNNKLTIFLTTLTVLALWIVVSSCSKDDPVENPQSSTSVDRDSQNNLKINN
jgi:hypothetical protein